MVRLLSCPKILSYYYTIHVIFPAHTIVIEFHKLKLFPFESVAPTLRSRISKGCLDALVPVWGNYGTFPFFYSSARLVNVVMDFEPVHGESTLADSRMTDVYTC